MVEDQWNIIISRIFNSFAGELRKRERVGEGGEEMEGEGEGGGGRGGRRWRRDRLLPS